MINKMILELRTLRLERILAGGQLVHGLQFGPCNYWMPNDLVCLTVCDQLDLLRGSTGEKSSVESAEALANSGACRARLTRTKQFRRSNIRNKSVVLGI